MVGKMAGKILGKMVGKRPGKRPGKRSGKMAGKMAGKRPGNWMYCTDTIGQAAVLASSVVFSISSLTFCSSNYLSSSFCPRERQLLVQKSRDFPFVATIDDAVTVAEGLNLLKANVLGAQQKPC